MWLVIPVKDFAGAKQRLSGCLSPGERAELYQAMLEDVLECAGQIKTLDEIVLVTRDPMAMKLAGESGARVLREPANRSHTEAVRFAVDQLLKDGVGTMLTLPGDVPLVTTAEVNALIDAHAGAAAFTIAPSHDCKGSNAVMCTPPDIIPLEFGPDSYYPHLEQVRRIGIEPDVVSLPGIALDIDTPDDLANFAACRSNTRTQSFLDCSGIATRLLTAKTS